MKKIRWSLYPLFNLYIHHIKDQQITLVANPRLFGKKIIIEVQKEASASILQKKRKDHCSHPSHYQLNATNSDPQSQPELDAQSGNSSNKIELPIPLRRYKVMYYFPSNSICFSLNAICRLLL